MNHYAQLLSPGDSEIWRRNLISVIELMLSIGHYEYLFNEFRNKVSRLSLKNLFLECLEPFIIRNQVKQIKLEAFREVL